MTDSFLGRLILAFLAVALIATLTACGTSKPAEVWKYQTILIAPDAAMMQHCPVEPPPDPTTYRTADLSAREGLDVKAYNTQTKNISLCNQGFDRLNDWVTQQKALYPNAVASAASAPSAASSP